MCLTSGRLIDYSSKISILAEHKGHQHASTLFLSGTGTMLALNKIIEDIDGGAQDIDIFNTVLNLRSERVLMVQKLIQYEFLHVCTDYYLGTKNWAAENTRIESYYVNSISIDEDDGIEY